MVSKFVRIRKWSWYELTWVKFLGDRAEYATNCPAELRKPSGKCRLAGLPLVTLNDSASKLRRARAQLKFFADADDSSELAERM